MRQPWNIYVFIYNKYNADVKFALLKRADDGKWQCVSGGGEDNETYKNAAIREIYEETGIKNFNKFIKLDTISYIKKTIFKCEHYQQDEDLYVIPMYYYGIEIDGKIKLSHEHTEYCWLPYEDAQNLLYWHGQKTALWELNERLKRGEQ